MPGVMITQFMEELPEGVTTPDFTRKPIALTIQEGNVSGRNTDDHLKLKKYYHFSHLSNT